VLFAGSSIPITTFSGSNSVGVSLRSLFSFFSPAYKRGFCPHRLCTALPGRLSPPPSVTPVVLFWRNLVGFEFTNRPFSCGDNGVKVPCFFVFSPTTLSCMHTMLGRVTLFYQWCKWPSSWEAREPAFFMPQGNTLGPPIQADTPVSRLS